MMEIENNEGESCMYYNKKRTKTIALLEVILLLGVCGCNTEVPVQEVQKQENVAGTVTEAVVQEETGITEVVDEEEAEITQALTEEKLGTAGEVKPTETVKPEPGDALKELEPEELVLHVLTNAEGVYFTSGGVGETELRGYAEEEDIAYFILKKQNGFGRTQEEVYVGVLNPETGELLQYYCYGNTISDAVMIERESGLYILYATECRDFGFYSGYGGALLAKDGILLPVWPLTSEGVYDDDYWNGHTAELNGETLEIYKVIITEVRPDGIASEMITELERTVSLDEILAGAV